MFIKFKTVENMKKARKIGWALVGLACIGVGVYGKLYTYNALEQTGENYLLLDNIEALATIEGEGGDRYPDLAGKPEFCTMYIYKKAGITVAKGENVNPSYEGNAEYTKEKKEGLKDKCPREGNGCNPYSCQEVPY